ncbi:DUF3037 domain-containing protein, partial [Streptomyces lasiicapitis]|uniref:DUF3037 domain-containing protein n=1 Tax=Streptomyces lasiicapitis TaxID=1923961 RepID=UPI0036C4C255
MSDMNEASDAKANEAPTRDVPRSKAPARDVFEYALLRVVPRVERGEQFNAGVVLYCRAKSFVAARTHLDEAKLRALDPAADAARGGAAQRAVEGVSARAVAAGQRAGDV